MSSDKGESDKGSSDSGPINSGYLQKVYLFHILVVAPTLLYFGLTKHTPRWQIPAVVGGLALLYHLYSLVYSKATGKWNWNWTGGPVPKAEDIKNKSWLTNIYYFHILLATPLLYLAYLVYKKQFNNTTTKLTGVAGFIGLLALAYHARTYYEMSA